MVCSDEKLENNKICRKAGKNEKKNTELQATLKQKSFQDFPVLQYFLIVPFALSFSNFNPEVEALRSIPYKEFLSFF